MSVSLLNQHHPVPLPSAPDAPDEPLLTRIAPSSGWKWLKVGELWQSRELLFFLTWRDVKIRYKQTVLGLAWAVVQPLAAMVVFVLFLGRLGGTADAIPNYGLFVFAGMLGWTFFANAVTQAATSVVNNERLVTKVYFPRLLLPFSGVGAALFDFCVALGLLGVYMAVVGTSPGWSVLALPLVMGLLIITALGVGTFLAALIVAQRDFRYVLNFGVQLWMFATPAIYLNAATFGPIAKTYLPLNPAHGLIQNLRACLFGESLDLYALAVSGTVGIVLFAIGAAYFRRTERAFADLI